MRLSKRIYALANNVIDGHSIADIGTDHGYVRDGSWIRPYAFN